MKIIMIAAFMLITLCCEAQRSDHASVSWGPELEGSRRGSISDYLGSDESGFYLTAYMKKDALIQKIDSKLGNPAIYTFEEKDEQTKEKYDLEGRMYFADKLYVFKSLTDKKTKSKILYAQEINKSSMQQVGSLKKVTEFQYEKNRDKGFFSMVPSSDNNYMMIVEGIPTEKEENDQFNVVMLDETLTEVYRKNITVPYQNSLFFREEFICDNDGDFYLLGKLYKDKVKTRVKGEVNYMYHILAFNNKGADKMDYEVKLASNYITDITFTINDNGNLVTAGFYSKKGLSSIDGAFFMTLDAKSKAVISSNLKEFDIEFLTEYMTEAQEKRARKKEEKGKDSELYQYDMRKLVRRSDGGVILVGEQFYITTTTVRTGNTTYTRRHYHYNEIIVINIDPAGQIQWAKKIPKMQVSTDDGGFYSSFAMGVTDEYLHFIYNDHIDNMEVEKTRKLKNFQVNDRNGIVVDAYMDNNGKLTRKPLMENTETEVIIRPKVCEQIDEGKMMIFGERRKLEQFGMVTFK